MDILSAEKTVDLMAGVLDRDTSQLADQQVAILLVIAWRTRSDGYAALTDHELARDVMQIEALVPVLKALGHQERRELLDVFCYEAQGYESPN